MSRADRLLLPALASLALAAQIAVAAPAAAVPDAARAVEFIRQGIARTVDLLRSKQMPREEIAHRLREELRSGFDVPMMGRYALGALSRDLTAEQERRYLHEFEDFIVQTYTQRVYNVQPRAGNIATDILEVTGSTVVSSEQILVHSRINQTGARWVDIDWRLRERENRLRIIDVSIVGISQSQVNRSEFSAVASRSGGLDGLIEALRRRNEELRAK